MKRANQQKTNLVQINVQVLKKARDASKKFNQNPIISSLISLSLSPKFIILALYLKPWKVFSRYLSLDTSL